MKTLPSAGSVLLCGEQAELKGPPLSRLTRILGFDDQACPVELKLARMAAPSKKAARKRALDLITYEAWRVVVMLGRKTATAFGHEGPFFTGTFDHDLGCVPLVSLPTPSSREWRYYLVHRARELLRQAAPDLPWGVFDDPLARFIFACRLAAESAFWTVAVPVDLRMKLKWDEADLMVALDAVERRGLPRTSGALLIARYRALGVTEVAA